MWQSSAPRSLWPLCRAKTLEREERIAEQLRHVFSDFVPSDSTPLAKKKHLDAQRLAEKVKKTQSSYLYLLKKWGLWAGLPLLAVGAYVNYYVVPRRKLIRDVKSGKLPEIMNKPRSMLNMHELALRNELEEQKEIMASIEQLYSEKEVEDKKISMQELSEFVTTK